MIQKEVLVHPNGQLIFFIFLFTGIINVHVYLLNPENSFFILRLGVEE